MKKIFELVLAIVLAFSFVGCSKKTEMGNFASSTSPVEIPNVFGVYYEDAIDVLEAEGFEVKAIEADAKSTFHNLYDDRIAHLRPKYLEKGAVFKVDDYTQRGDGCLMKNDDIMFNGIFSNDKSLVIYYAKASYSGSDGTTISRSNEEEKITEESAVTSSKEISSEFKSAMDSYEEFIDEYVSILKKYQKNPNDSAILKKYLGYIEKYDKVEENFEKWDSNTMTTAEAEYYIEVQNRVTEKLAELNQ